MASVLFYENIYEHVSARFKKWNSGIQPLICSLTSPSMAYLDFDSRYRTNAVEERSYSSPPAV